MKIVVLSIGIPSERYPINGIFEFDQAKALAQAGHEVCSLALDFRAYSFKRRFGFFRYQKEGVNIYELSLPLGVYRRALPLLQRIALWAFGKIVKEKGKPEVVHAHFYSMGAIGSIIKEKYGLPYIITEHSSKLNKTKEQISKLDCRLAQTAYRHCDLLITVSKALSQRIKENFGKDNIVIHNIVDTSTFLFEGRLPHQGIAFVSVGNLTKNKGFDILIKAFASLPDTATLDIIGDGLEKESLQQLTDSLNLSNRINFHGLQTRQKIQQIYSRSDVFALASHSETFGLSYVEAMLAGLPVIATRCGGPEDFVNENNGILVPTDDCKALSAAMNSFISSKNSFDSQSIAAFAESNFSPKSIAGKITEAYRHCFMIISRKSDI